MSGLLRTQHTLSFDNTDEETGFGIDPIDQNPLPGQVLTNKEDSVALNKALGDLSMREKLVIRMRYEDTLAVAAIAEILRLETREIKNLLKSSLYKLRKVLL